MRDNRLTVLLTEKERQLLKELAIAEHRSESEMVRALIYGANKTKSSAFFQEKKDQPSTNSSELDY